MQKARGHPGTGPGLPPIVGVRFQVLFTPLPAVLFTFPSRYLCTIGLPVIFSLARWCWPVQAGFLRSRPTQGTRPGSSRTCTGLSPSMAAFSKRAPLWQLPFPQALQPPAARNGVWAVPLPLAATHGITDCFLFLRVLRCFSSPGRCPGTRPGRRRFTPAGCPIRTPADQRSFAPPRSFSQLTASFVIPGSLGIPRTPFPASYACTCPTACTARFARHCSVSAPNLVNELLPPPALCRRGMRTGTASNRPAPPLSRGPAHYKRGGYRSRTDDLLNANQVL